MTLLMEVPATVSWDGSEPMPATITVVPIGAQAKTASPTVAESTETDPVLALLTGTALHLTVHGWTQGTLQDSAGRYCLIGAMMAVSRKSLPGILFGMGPVEEHAWNVLAAAVRKRTGEAILPQRWNDWYATDLADVLKLIGEAMELRRADLAEAAK